MKQSLERIACGQLSDRWKATFDREQIEEILEQAAAKGHVKDISFEWAEDGSVTMIWDD